MNFLRQYYEKSYLPCGHCSTSRKVAGSIPDRVIWIFHWHNPSGRNMALGLTQPLTEMITGNISWGKDGRCVGLKTLHLMFRIFWNLGASTSWNPQGHCRPVMGLLYLYLYRMSGLFSLHHVAANRSYFTFSTQHAFLTPCFATMANFLLPHHKPAEVIRHRNWNGSHFQRISECPDICHAEPKL